jgi:hypothetical protein
MSMEEFDGLFFVTRDARQKVFEVLRHRAKHVHRDDQPAPEPRIKIFSSNPVLVRVACSIAAKNLKGFSAPR